jgi:hypothetical protein
MEVMRRYEDFEALRFRRLEDALWFESSCYRRAIGTIDNEAMLL